MNVIGNGEELFSLKSLRGLFYSERFFLFYFTHISSWSVIIVTATI